MIRYVCTRCGHVQQTAAQCGMCLWGDLYEEEFAGPERSFVSSLVTFLREEGWTIKHSGVIYDRDPGDEHVWPDTWKKQ